MLFQFQSGYRRANSNWQNVILFAVLILFRSKICRTEYVANATKSVIENE